MLLRAILLALIIVFSGVCLADDEENVRIAKSMVDVINDRDLERLVEFVTHDVVRHSAATAGVVVTNLEEFKAFLKSDFAAVPDSVMSVDIIFGNQDFVAMRAVYAGTQSGQMGPFPPTGKRFELPFIGILKIDGVKISEIWVEWDNVFALSQLGHLSPPSE